MHIKGELCKVERWQEPSESYYLFGFQLWANFTLAGSKWSLGTAGNGMEHASVGSRSDTVHSALTRGLKLWTLSSDISIHTRAHTDTHEQSDSMFTKLYIGTVVWDEWGRSRPLFNRQKRRQRKSCCCPGGGEAANGTNRYQKKWRHRAVFAIFEHTFPCLCAPDNRKI